MDIDRMFELLRYRLRNRGVADADLRFSRAQLADSVILEALLATLAHPDWSAARRLEVIHEQLVSRVPASGIN